MHQGECKSRRLSGAHIREFIECAGDASGASDYDVVCNLESALLEELTGNACAGRTMVFIGSEICFSFSEENCVILQSGDRLSGPVMYGESLTVMSTTNTSSMQLTKGVGPVLTTDKFDVHIAGGYFMKWFGTTHKKRDVTLRVILKSSDLTAWIDSCARDENCSLEKKAYLAEFVINNKAELGVVQGAVDDYLAEFVINNKAELGVVQGAVDDAIIQFVLADSANLFEHVIQEQAHIGEKWKDVTDGLPQSLESEVVASECFQIYKRNRMKFLSNIFGFVAEGLFLVYLKAKVQEELQRKRQKLNDSFRQEQSECVATFKSEVLKIDGSRPKIILELCEKHSNNTVKIRFQKEELQNERVSWKAIELVPNKKDLDMQANSPEHLIEPRIFDVGIIIDVDASEFSLFKVILLKSDQVLILMKGVQTSSLDIYLCNSLKAGLNSGKLPIRNIKRGTDLVAFDEISGFIAFYDAGNAVIKVYRFDDTFRDMHWNGVTISLASYRGSTNITWMEFIPGKEELLLANDEQCMRVFEAVLPGMMKPRTITLPPSLVRLCLTTDGLCLVAVCLASTEEDVDSVEEDGSLVAEIYRLDDTLERMTSVDLMITVQNAERVQFTVSTFGTQMQMLIFDGEHPEILHSLVLNVTVSSQCCHLQRSNVRNMSEAGSEAVGDRNNSSRCHELDYLYHVFDKYAVAPPLLRASRNLQFGLLLSVVKGERENIGGRFVGHAKTVEQIKKEKGKDFSNLRITFSSQFVEQEELSIQAQERNMGEFVRQLMCLVPVQIARAQNNSLKPLVDGLEVGAGVNYADAIQLAEIVRFGLYDAILDSWTGPVKVISSMGKQSSGKSYLLNHLSGSMLDVAGGRCTDGVWMTSRVADECLYIILDFEGLGSFERSEQEDMLLSILNAAISNITIFNKKDFHLDKETEAVFERFQNGVSLVKEDDKLFKGLFYMAIKDVDAADVDDLREEFFSKIKYICSNSQDNFLTKMYGGNVEIAAMPPFNRGDFHESISDIAQTVEDLEPVHKTGKSFLRDLKLLISQMCSKDWSPMDTKRISFKINMLKKHLYSAVAMGSLADGKPLVDFDSEVEIEERPLIVSSITYDVADTSLLLARYEEMDVIGNVLEKLVPKFEKQTRRGGVMRDEEWHENLENFLGGLAGRRKTRVLEWIGVNTADFSSDGDVQKLALEATAMVAEVKEKLALCSCKCDQCFLRCILEKAHTGGHSCRGNHRCADLCSFCQEETIIGVERCTDVAGHEGRHDCKLTSHTCGKPCYLKQKASNCNKSCSLKAAHEGEHKCNSRQHMCKANCSLRSCPNTCVSPVELTNHTWHSCHEKMCIMQCCMDGCSRKCAVEDHFHSMKVGAVHLCGNEHKCDGKCEAKGNCDVITEVSRKTQTYVGRRSTFEYDHVSEQNGVRKDCCAIIPASELEHQGAHLHTVNPNAIHFCEARCQGCGYYCNLPIDHMGLHDTTHGNMTQKIFVAESEEVEIEGRKYEWGESGTAEMCMMHCKAQGRGHIHLTLCEMGNVDGVCGVVKVPEGVRHETRRYGPDFDVPKDEFTHAAYWKNMRFKDPCLEDDQKQFALCGNFCQSTEHNSTTGTGIIQGKSYCTEKLWHKAVPKSVSNAGTGYVTDDGHHFPCYHYRDIASHVIFVVDKSKSMYKRDIAPKMANFPCNRLGCVYEAMVRFVRTRLSANLQDTMSVVLFDSFGLIGVERQPMAEDVINSLVGHRGGRGTTYSSGLEVVEQILNRSYGDATLASKAPTVIFLSDGGNKGGIDPVYFLGKLMGVDQRLVVHTIMFGTDPAKDILINMAAAGNGVFQVSIDELQLARSFEGLADSLRPKVSSLM